jgi:hypothetical protein
MWGGVPGVPATFAKSQTWRWTNEIVKFGGPGRRCSGFSPVIDPPACLPFVVGAWQMLLWLVVGLHRQHRASSHIKP